MNCRFLQRNPVPAYCASGMGRCRWLKEITSWKQIIHPLNFCISDIQRKKHPCIGWRTTAKAGGRRVCDQVGMIMMSNRFVIRGRKEEKSYCKIETIVFFGWVKISVFLFYKKRGEKEGQQLFFSFFGNFFTCRHKMVCLNHLWRPSSFCHIWRLKVPSPSKASLTTLLKGRGGQESHIWLVSVPESSRWRCRCPEIATLLWSRWGAAQSRKGSGS